MLVKFSAADSERIKARSELIPDASRRSIGGIVFTRRRRTSVIGILLIDRCIIHLRGFPSAPGVPEITKSLPSVVKKIIKNFLFALFTCNI